MKLKQLLVLGIICLVGCSAPGDVTQQQGASFSASRRGFQTSLLSQESENQPVTPPPATLFQLVRYPSSVGKLAAYLSQPPQDQQKRPAIIWVFGGFQNSIDSTAWDPAPPENDQSASAFRSKDIIMMYPSFRGGNDNPGVKEALLGEVDDVLAAADFLAKQDFVDANRIYLGGHSTGGTLVLLAAAASDRFRAVFSFGPVDDVRGYGVESLPFDSRKEQEIKLRSPIHWMESIQSPTFVFEGAKRGNIEALESLAQNTQNPKVQFYPIDNQDHFSILAPLTPLIADKIITDEDSTSMMSFTPEEVTSAFD